MEQEIYFMVDVSLSFLKGSDVRHIDRVQKPWSLLKPQPNIKSNTLQETEYKREDIGGTRWEIATQVLMPTESPNAHVFASYHQSPYKISLK